MKHKFLILALAGILFLPTVTFARMLDEDTHPQTGGGGGTGGIFHECNPGAVKYDGVNIHNGHFAKFKHSCDPLGIWISGGWTYLSTSQVYSYLESQGQNHTKYVAPNDSATSYEVWKINDTKQWVRVIGGNIMSKGRYSGLRPVKTVGHQHSNAYNPSPTIARVSINRNNAKFRFSTSSHHSGGNNDLRLTKTVISTSPAVGGAVTGSSTDLNLNTSGKKPGTKITIKATMYYFGAGSGWDDSEQFTASRTFTVPGDADKAEAPDDGKVTSHRNGGGSSSNKGGGSSNSKPDDGSLRKGDTGTEVKNLQKNLNTIGNYKLVVDGIFGSKTQSAVKSFQSKYKLSPTGVADNSTKNKISEVLKATNSNPLASALYPTKNQKIKSDQKTGLGKVQFVGSSTGGLNAQMKVQVMYRKVGETTWTSFGTKAAIGPDGKLSKPNKINQAPRFINEYGWSCVMGFGKKLPANCDSVWTNGKVSGKPAFSGYKVYSPSVQLKAGQYEYAVRALNVTNKKYSQKWSSVLRFEILPPPPPVKTQ